MYYKILLFLGLWSAINSYGITPDSTLFTSGFEQNVFRQLADSSGIDSIDLFIALDYAPGKINAKERVSSSASLLKSKTGVSPSGKTLKTIYKSVHDEFFEQYAEDAFFNDVFNTGKYNCVTASAMFALILDHMGIRYTIKETPTHVYLIADPDNTGYLIETTLPAEKMVTFDERFKTTYTEYLHNNKIISDDEYKNTSTEELFKRHYSSDKTITLKELAGIQYYNKGVFLFTKALYAEALKNFEKAEILNGSDLIKYMKNNSLLNVLNEENRQKKYNGRTLARYINANDSNAIGLQYGQEYFNAVSTELMVNHPDAPAYTKYFKQLTNHLAMKDTSEIYRVYYTFQGYYAMSQYRYSLALKYLGEAYAVNPLNIQTKQLIHESISKGFSNEMSFYKHIDSLEYYYQKFPFLLQDKNMLKFLEYYYLMSITALYEMEEVTRGSALLKRYNAFLAGIENFEPTVEYLTAIYQMVGYYYLYGRQEDLAEQTIRRGLRLCPDAQELKEMLTGIIRSKGGNYKFPELMDDAEPTKKYLIALANAKDNSIAINDSAGKNLQQAWDLHTITASSQPATDDSSMKLKVTLLDNNRFVVLLNDERLTGKWTYTGSNCTLNLQPDQDRKSLHILVGKITRNRMEGMFYRQNDFANSLKAVFTSY